MAASRVQIVDSHTGGEPTRVVVSGGPDLGGGSVADQWAVFRREHDRFRAAVVNEPRGSDVLVGALLVPPADPTCQFGVLFFNNVGLLQMCGHGTIGLIVTLRHLGRIGPGNHRVETCVGPVDAELHGDGSVTIGNVPSHRAAAGVELNVAGQGRVRGDVAWGGNWFFLVREAAGLPAIQLSHVVELTMRAGAVRDAVHAAGHPEVDHVEFFGPGVDAGVDSRNFVLCPGNAYDRSPCGTGTSAKLACLAADGELEEGDVWVQESIVGSRFIGRYRWLDRVRGIVAPQVTGTAHVTGMGDLILDPGDPFCWGIQSAG